MEKEKTCFEAGRIDFENISEDAKRNLMQMFDTSIPIAYKYFLHSFMLNAEATPENLKLLNSSLEMLTGIKV